MDLVSPNGQSLKRKAVAPTQVDPRVAITNTLLTGPKTPSKLRREVMGLGVAPSTYHYTLRQMIKHGEVEEATYEYKGQGVSDALVEELLMPLSSSTESQAIELSKNLEFLAKKRDIALKARFLSSIQDCLRSELADVRRSALLALSDTLWNLSETPENKRAREIINKSFFEGLTHIIRDDTDLDIKASAVRIVPTLGDPRGIDVLIEVVEKATDEDYHGLKNSIEQAIVWPYKTDRRPRNLLTRHHHAKILIRLSQLAAQGNVRASELASMIRRGAPGI